MEFDENNELDDESYDSSASDDISENDLGFNSDELLDNLDELELFDEEPDLHTEKLDSINENYILNGGVTSISLKERTPVSVFRAFFTEGILNLITDQTNIYAKKEKNEIALRRKQVTRKM